MVAEVGSFTPWISTELQQRATDEERAQRILHVSIISKAFWPPIQNTGPSQPLQLSCTLSSYQKNRMTMPLKWVEMSLLMKHFWMARPQAYKNDSLWTPCSLALWTWFSKGFSSWYPQLVFWHFSLGDYCLYYSSEYCGIQQGYMTSSTTCTKLGEKPGFLGMEIMSHLPSQLQYFDLYTTGAQ